MNAPPLGDSGSGSPATGAPTSLFARAKSNLEFRSRWAEINGAMGDLGTYIPIIMALALAKELDLGTTLIFTGVCNIVTGIIYGVPMPVQPMKAISAVAISSPDFGVPEIAAAGVCTAAVVIFLGVTGLMGFVYRFIPLPVVRGVQLAQGLSFAMTAAKYIRNNQNIAKAKSLEPRPWLGLDGLVLAIAAACFIVIVNGADEKPEDSDADGSDLDGRPRKKKKKILKILFSMPSAFIVFLLGVVLAVVRRPSLVKELEFGPSRMEVVKISKQAWKDGFLKGAVPQIPLTLLNSVIAVCKLTKDLFPEKEASAKSVSITVGLMNITGSWFGAMPSCHGAGGLAGQYKFGGRSGGCVAALGAAKLVLGLVLGSSILRVFERFPVGLLGVLLLFAGLELAMAARDMTTKAESFVMLVCTGISLVGSSAALGFVTSVVVYLLLKLRMLVGRQ